MTNILDLVHCSHGPIQHRLSAIKEPSGFATILLAGFLIAVSAMFAAGPARAEWPERPISLVVPFAPGGPSDLIARILADGLSQQLGKPVVISNRPGNGGNTGLDAAASEKPDGYTLLMAPQALVTFNPHLYTDMRFDPRKDMLPVGIAFRSDMILVARKGMEGSLQSVIDEAKKKPGQLTYGSAGNGTASQILFELLKAQAGIHVRQIPYKGTGPALTDLMSGTIDLMIDSLASTAGQIDAGSVVAVAVCGPVRNPRLPNVPTFTEAGLPNYKAAAWHAIMVPMGTPQPVIDKLTQAMETAVKRQDVTEKAKKLGVDPAYQDPSGTARQIAADSEMWGEIIRKAGIKLN